MSKVNRVDSDENFNPDDLEKVEITQDESGSVRLTLCFRSYGETKAFEFPKMEQAIAFYEEIWSSRTLPSDDEELIEVCNVR